MFTTMLIYALTGSALLCMSSAPSISRSPSISRTLSMTLPPTLAMTTCDPWQIMGTHSLCLAVCSPSHALDSPLATTNNMPSTTNISNSGEASTPIIASAAQSAALFHSSLPLSSISPDVKWKEYAERFGEETWKRHAPVWIDGDWLPMYRYQCVGKIMEYWTEWTVGLDGYLPV